MDLLDEPANDSVCLLKGFNGEENANASILMNGLDFESQVTPLMVFLYWCVSLKSPKSVNLCEIKKNMRANILQ